MKNLSVLSAAGVMAAVPAFAADPTAELFSSVDISAISANVTTLGVAIIGIALAFKGISLVKAAISKV